MSMTLIDTYNQLIKIVSEISEVLSIGKSGGEELPEQDKSDIDIFLFCSEIPDTEKRYNTVIKLGTALSDVNISEKGERFWGVCDYVTMKNTEICLMYFTIADMNRDIESILNGLRLDREGEYFYPTGRCATFLSMHILYDEEGYISDMKKKLSLYPQHLAEMLVNHHIRMIDDDEDFNRAVSRGDVLFYHSTLESAMDHFLQALFAFNYCFFPSRKRTIQFIEGFKYKPQNCSERLLKVVELGSNPETLSLSYEIWSRLCKELLEMACNAV